MEERETPRMRKYGESKTTRIMSTVPHVTSGSGLRKFQADGFLLDRVYKFSAVHKFSKIPFKGKDLSLLIPQPLVCNSWFRKYRLNYQISLKKISVKFRYLRTKCLQVKRVADFNIKKEILLSNLCRQLFFTLTEMYSAMSHCMIGLWVYLQYLCSLFFQKYFVSCKGYTVSSEKQIIKLTVFGKEA